MEYFDFYAKFLAKFCLTFQNGDRFGAVESAYHELRAWLTTKISWFEQVQLLQSKSDSAASMDYEEYLRFRSVSDPVSSENQNCPKCQ